MTQTTNFGLISISVKVEIYRDIKRSTVDLFVLFLSENVFFPLLYSQLTHNSFATVIWSHHRTHSLSNGTGNILRCVTRQETTVSVALMHFVFA